MVNDIDLSGSPTILECCHPVDAVLITCETRFGSCGVDEVLVAVDGCYSSKFLRSSARRFLLEIIVRGKRYEVARAGLVH